MALWDSHVTLVSTLGSAPRTFFSLDRFLFAWSIIERALQTPQLLAISHDKLAVGWGERRQQAVTKYSR
jgi:hypothetical protein